MTKSELLRSALISLGLLLVLLLMGRTPVCDLGDWSPWISSPNSHHTSQHLFDPYSFTHFEHGVIFLLLLTLIKKPRLDLAVLIESIWEVVENSPFIINRYRAETAALDYFGDSILNSSGDLLSCVLGFIIARRLNWKYSILMLIIIELILLWAIRDNLAINVIMLTFPITAIKNWQLAP